jgi:hypothetical protein
LTLPDLDGGRGAGAAAGDGGSDAIATVAVVAVVDVEGVVDSGLQPETNKLKAKRKIRI